MVETGAHFLPKHLLVEDGKQNLPRCNRSLSLILLLFSCFLNTLLKRTLQEKISRICFSEVMWKPRIIGLLFWLTSPKLRIVLFAAPISPTLHTYGAAVNHRLLWIHIKGGHADQRKPECSTHPPKHSLFFLVLRYVMPAFIFLSLVV